MNDTDTKTAERARQADLALSDPAGLAGVVAARLGPQRRLDELKDKGFAFLRVDDVVDDLGLTGCDDATRAWVEHRWNHAAATVLARLAEPLRDALEDLATPDPAEQNR
jgi:hypothetical protein